MSGCASYIGDRIIEPPNQADNQLVLSESFEAFWTNSVEKHYFADRIELESPVDGTRLITFVLPAGDYPHSYQFAMDGPGKARLEFNTSPALGPQRPARGSMLFLHGWHGSHRQMFFHALALAEEGWDGYLVDLRGHGQSGGNQVSFGIHENGDVRGIVERIRRNPEFAEPLVVFGASLGGAVALMAAAGNPQIDAVIALAPYADFKQILPTGLKMMAPRYMRPWLGPRRVEQALAHAEKMAGIDLGRAAPVMMAGDVSQPVLLIHGTDDRFIPMEHSRQLDRLLPNSQLSPIDERAHIPLMLDRDTVLKVIIPWLEAFGQPATGNTAMGNH